MPQPVDHSRVAAGKQRRAFTDNGPQVLVAVFLFALFVLIVSGYFPRAAQAQIAVRNQGYVPYTEAPINYRTQEPVDPVALLQKQIDAGTAQLTYSEDKGYLKSVLAFLNIPAQSQTLVFSKTSFQYTHISPEHPRALYFNDDVYVGSVHQGKAIEVISFDPTQGAMFYVLDERNVGKPVFQRAELDCTQCHIAPGTRGVPGVFLQSVYATPTGSLAPRAPFLITDQKSPLKDRWGGWYVTGELAQQTMANATVVTDTEGRKPGTPPELTKQAPVYDPGAYLRQGSDEVALLVLGHQTQMHNLITLVNYQTRLALYALAQDQDSGPSQGAAPEARLTLESLPEKTQEQIKAPAEQLLRYLLFANETPLGGLDAKRVISGSAFARTFAARGERDKQGRSLRDFDLHDRLFRYPCSYLIYSSAFDALPASAKGYVYHRLLQILTGQDTHPDFAALSAENRATILSILLETKAGLPAEWREYQQRNQSITRASTGVLKSK